MSWLSSATGIHISPKGVKIEPGKALTTALATLTGNPAAIAAAIGNSAHAIAPNSGLGRVGDTVGKVGALASPFVGGGLGALSQLPGAGGVSSALGKIPGVSSVGGRVAGLLGINPAGSGGLPATMPALSYDPDTNTVAGGGSGGILGQVGSLLGLGPNMTPADKIALARMGLDTVGGIAGGISSANDRAKQLAEQQRQFNLPAAATASRALANAPLRNMGAAGVAGYAAAGPPAPFKPHDIFNAGGEAPGQIGGYDPAKVAAGTAGYKPPGTDDETYRRILQMTGFGGVA